MPPLQKLFTKQIDNLEHMYKNYSEKLGSIKVGLIPFKS